MDWRANEAAGNRVYEVLKARAIAYEFPQGERILLGPLAAELGVSRSPVQEALNRLAAQNLVIKAPRKGFIAMRLLKDDLLGHYELTRLFLTYQLATLEPAIRQTLHEYEPIAKVLTKLKRCPQSDFSILARYTGEIFASIGALRENSLVIHAIDIANDHLFYIRTVESQHLDDVQDELTRMCELLLGGYCTELIEAIEIYHDRRVALLPELMAQLTQ